MSETQDERLFDAVKKQVMNLINEYRPIEEDDNQTTLERFFWNYVEVNAGDIAESIIEADPEAPYIYLIEEYLDLDAPYLDLDEEDD